jgi:Pectate lyase superfamily protein
MKYGKSLPPALLAVEQKSTKGAANMLKKLVLLAIAMLFIGGVLSGPRLMAQTPYDLPNDDSNCPGSCRQVPWKAGSDLWNGGTLPNYTSVTCSGLAGNGSTNDGPAIQACINSASAGTAVFIPAGVYYVNSSISLKSNVALRGAKASGPPYLPSADSSATTFKLGGSGSINMGSGSTGSNSAISSGYTKGSTSITMSSSGFATGDWIIVSENPDSAVPVTKTGDDGDCNWCGENDGVHLMAQIMQVTGVSGSTLTLSRPLYYTFKSSLSPVARKITFSVSKAGLENIRLDGSGADHPAFIYMQNSLYNWVKGVETYHAGSGAKASHVESEWSYGSEIRDNYFHHGRDSSSDRNYGIAFLFVNSDHKVENNILRNHRHSTDFEGGGSGIAILYNYVDDDYTDDTSYLGSARANHGAHPYMNLYEGNIYSHITADSYWGSSSHNVFFRNWLWGDESSASDVPAKPSWGNIPVDVWQNQNYYSFVGNVLGVTGKWMNPSWSSFSLRNTNCSGSPIYDYGCNSNGGYSSAASTTSINHGNFDYKTNGVAYWEGGTNHDLRDSMYYNTKPGFFGSCAWPAFGPDLSPMTGTLPAKARFDGTNSCGGTVSLAPPTNVVTTVH